MRKEWFVYQINGFRMFAELREQLAAEQFETKFFVGISCGQKVFWPQHHIFILTYSPVRNYQLSDLLSHNFDPWIEPRERGGSDPFALTVANALTGFFWLPCLRSQSDDFYYYSTKKARTFKTEHWIYLNSYKTDNISSHSSPPWNPSTVLTVIRLR